MATQALYNKWRGQTFDDILGQEHITTTLQNQVRSGRIGHAYLFVGLRGTGKTSTARILAKAVNCIGQTNTPPCNQCHICTSLTEGRSTDLIEIDAASNRGIDEIRELREGVAFLPNECRYKVYVIDEVHMLTKEAFNALLKTLEEPPPRVIFILCTTEVQNLPATVLSRCQRFDFRRGSLETITRKLQRICDQEQIRIAPDALDYIARRATGSYRDAESLLDQLAAFGTEEISLKQIKAVLGSAPSQQVQSLVNALLAQDLSEGLRTLNGMLDEGADPREIIIAVIDELRALAYILAGTEDDLALGEEDLTGLRAMTRRYPTAMRAVINAIRLFNDAAAGIRNAARPHIPLELAFIDACLTVHPEGKTEQGIALTQPTQLHQHPQAMPAPITRNERSTPAGAPTTAQEPAVSKPAASTGTSEAPAAHAPIANTGDAVLTLEQVQQVWDQILGRVRELNPQVRALLTTSPPIAVHGNVVVLGCSAAFHRDRLMEDSRRQVVEEVLSSVLRTRCTIACEVAQTPKARVAAAGQPAMPQDPREAQKRRLRNHPAVQTLERLGGQITDITLNDIDDEEGTD